MLVKLKDLKFKGASDVEIKASSLESRACLQTGAAMLKESNTGLHVTTQMVSRKTVKSPLIIIRGGG